MTPKFLEPKQNPNLTDSGLLILRLFIGTVFILHGAQKLFGAFGGPGIEGFAGWLGSMDVPAPVLSAWLAALAEFGGGIALITGVLTRLAALPLAFTMLVASFTAHAGKFFAQNGGMEYPITLAFIAVFFALAGPGRFTVIELVKALKGRSATQPQPLNHPQTT